MATVGVKGLLFAHTELRRLHCNSETVFVMLHCQPVAGTKMITKSTTTMWNTDQQCTLSSQPKKTVFPRHLSVKMLRFITAP